MYPGFVAFVLQNFIGVTDGTLYLTVISYVNQNLHLSAEQAAGRLSPAGTAALLCVQQ